MSIPLAAVPIVTEPRKHLSKTQIDLLRHADYWLMHRTPKGDWKGGGRHTRGKTMKPLITKQLLTEDYKSGRVSLRITMAGRMVLDTLAEARRRPTDSDIDEATDFGPSHPNGM